MPLKDEIKQLIKGNVLDDDQTLLTYSKDASIFEIKPKLVVFPKDSEDIKSLVKFVLKNNLSITVRSAGTDMTGGAIGEDIILDVGKYLNKLIKVDQESTIVQPGMLYRDFETETLKQDLLLPTYPASREICTVGGMVAANAGGELELTYGPINKYLKSMRVILSDGNEYTFQALNQAQLNKKIAQSNFEGKIYSEIYNLILENEELVKKARPQTSKNSTGYDLWEVWDGKNFDLSKLIIGSQGTLGIITEAEFKLIKPKKNRILLVIFLSDLSKLDRIINKVLEFKPEAFECFDDQTYQLAIDHAWDIAANFKHTNRISAFLNLKKDKAVKLTLLANFTSDDKDEALKKASDCSNDLNQWNIKTNVLKSEKDQEKYWLIRHKSFGLLMRYAGKHMKASSFIDDIIVNPEYLPQFLPKLNEIIAPYKDKMVYTLAGHIGDGNFHIIPLMDLSKADVRSIIPELMEKVFKLVFEYKGSMSAEHNDGLIRGPYLPQMYGNDIYQLFKKVKEIFDPKNIFNPHKKADATCQYSLAHMIKN
ncbi:FAD-binding oxidoreductase [Candidatus Daviesbacteria bacterium]|nr:FAD-binding oxidoreductase [Candidatus Daviesbacteria bacterium]